MQLGKVAPESAKLFTEPAIAFAEAEEVGAQPDKVGD